MRKSVPRTVCPLITRELHGNNLGHQSTKNPLSAKSLIGGFFIELFVKLLFTRIHVVGILYYTDTDLTLKFPAHHIVSR